MSRLTDYLRERRDRFIRRVPVQTVEFDPTFGQQVREQDIEVIDFDALLEEIDKFSETFE